MKDLNGIEELLKKYYRGDTSTREEETLRRFFIELKEIPEHLEAEAGLFGFFENQRSMNLPEDLENKLERMIPETEAGKPTIVMKRRYYWISGVAAAVLILIGIFLDMQIRKNSTLEVRQDTFEDPYLAYAEAKKALYMVSEKINIAREPLKNIEKLDATMNYMHPVFSFSSGIQHLEHFSKIEETRKLISKQ
jgi:hypothetical protein